MTTHFAYAVSLWLFLVGAWGLATSRNLIHMVNCLFVAQSSTYLFLLAVGYKKGGTAPVYSDMSPGSRAVDPIVQALTLTDIVVGAAVTALLLALVLRNYRNSKSLDPAGSRRVSG